jgi:NADH-quinone oxidoreductase subunit J
LFLLQGAQFLGVATVAVYVGAIVVTFLFVLMLAQPEGHAYFDRVSWGITPRFVGSVTAVLFAVLIASAVTRTDQTVIDDRQVLLDAINEPLALAVPTAKARAVRYERRGQTATARVTVAIPPDQRDAFETAAGSLARDGLRLIQMRHPDWEVRRLVFDPQDVMTPDNTASLGSRLFSRQLVAIQAGGALLMAALVGAVAIAGRTGPLEQ